MHTPGGGELGAVVTSSKHRLTALRWHRRLAPSYEQKIHSACPLYPFSCLCVDYPDYRELSGVSDLLTGAR